MQDVLWCIWAFSVLINTSDKIKLQIFNYIIVACFSYIAAKIYNCLFQIWREGKCVQLYPAENVRDQRYQKSAAGSVSWHWVMAKPHHAEKGPGQNSEMVWNIWQYFSCAVFSVSIEDFLPNDMCLWLPSPHSHEHIEILTVNGELLFFRQREGPFYPTLRLLHKCTLLLS